MLEYSANAVTRNAMERAHAERGKIVRLAWGWLFRSRKQPHMAGMADPA